MLFIAHRINRIEELATIPAEYGIEIDLRDSANKIIVTHDPFTDGVEFEEFIKHYHHSFIILNIKCEGIEFKIKEILVKYNITNYFFLDSSFPMIYKLVKSGDHNVALRFSEFEDINTILNMRGMVKWVWIDCFNTLPLDITNYKIFRDNGFNLCLVSPELQGRDNEIESYKHILNKSDINVDAICTKYYNVHRWLS